MPLSSAERCRRYREKLKRENPEKFEEMKKRNLERTKAKNKKITELNEEEKIATRKKWRDTKRKKKHPENPEKKTESNARRRRYRKQLHRENKELQERVVVLRQKNKSLRKMVLRYRNKIACLSLQVNELKTKKEDDSVVAVEDNLTSTQKANELTPMTKCNMFINEELCDVPEIAKERVKQKLLQQNVLEESLKETYKQSKSFEEKNTLKKVTKSDVVKKYKMQTKVSKCLGLNSGVRKYQSFRQKRAQTAKEIKNFYVRDDVSRMTAGKKEYVTYKKIQKQKRFLLNTLKNLYKKYRHEGGSVSFTTFKRYRPFYVVAPKLSNRNTTACIKHSNLKFKVETLKKLGVLDSNDLNDLVSKIVCSVTSKTCMYSECKTCLNKKLDIDIAGENREVSWLECVYRTHEFEKDGKQKITKKMVKQTKTGPLSSLVELMQSELQNFKIHHYNIYHQYRQYKESIENIEDDEFILHCDFSENYVCKMGEEVQAMHFGASKTQVSLHTAVLYLKNQKPICICTISPSLKHGPEAIWAHLKPITNLITQKFPGIRRMHVWSDGPTTQYRQKNNFFLFCQKTKGFTEATWSFFEASHGKGAADGVGGVVKRALDTKVAYGEDIIDAKAVFEVLSNSEISVKTFYVSESEVEMIKIPHPENILPVPSTMKIHQVILTENENILKYRPLSCFCRRGYCDCFAPKMHDLVRTTNIQKNERNKRERLKKQKKKSKRGQESSSENTDTEIEYAESDTTVCNEIEYLDDDQLEFIDEEIENIKNNLESETGDNNISIHNNEVKIKINKNKEIQEKTIVTETDESSTAKIKEKKEVKILADVRNTPENFKYFDLQTVDRMSLNEIGLDFNMCEKKIIEKDNKDKENICETVSNKKLNIELPTIEESGESNKDPEKEVDKVSNEDNVKYNEKNKEESKEEKKEELNEDKKGVLIEDSDSESPEFQDTISMNDAVLVRYFIRKQWKYYIGFVTKIDIKDDDTFFSVTFLKTMKTPKLKFIIPKKSDVDIITSISIVKKVRIAEDSASSFLPNDFVEKRI